MLLIRGLQIPRKTHPGDKKFMHLSLYVISLYADFLQTILLQKTIIMMCEVIVITQCMNRSETDELWLLIIDTGATSLTQFSTVSGYAASQFAFKCVQSINYN
jgi:hypothetical protein